jgi:hypothetical protein
MRWAVFSEVLLRCLDARQPLRLQLRFLALPFLPRASNLVRSHVALKYATLFREHSTPVLICLRRAALLLRWGNTHMVSVLQGANGHQVVTLCEPLRG